MKLAVLPAARLATVCRALQIDVTLLFGTMRWHVAARAASVPLLQSGGETIARPCPSSSRPLDNFTPVVIPLKRLAERAPRQRSPFHPLGEPNAPSRQKNKEPASQDSDPASTGRKSGCRRCRSGPTGSEQAAEILEHLSVEALREVSNRALALIDQKNDEVKRSFIGGVVGGAVSIGESIAGLFGGSEPAPKKRRSRKTRAGS
jgi:hypothetical protein